MYKICFNEIITEPKINGIVREYGFTMLYIMYLIYLIYNFVYYIKQKIDYQFISTHLMANKATQYPCPIERPRVLIQFFFLI